QRRGGHRSRTRNRSARHWKIAGALAGGRAVNLQNLSSRAKPRDPAKLPFSFCIEIPRLSLGMTALFPAMAIRVCESSIDERPLCRGSFSRRIGLATPDFSSVCLVAVILAGLYVFKTRK